MMDEFKRKRYEYHKEHKQGVGISAPKLNELGYDGWLLVAIHHDEWIFVREIDEAEEVGRDG